MLRFMRDYATSWFIKFILGAIVIVFVFWGVGNFGAQKESKAATVNGELITRTEYEDAFRNLVERYRQNFGSNFTNDMIERFNLKQQALDGLIDQKLILQEAEKLNFRVSEQELADSIMKIKAFQTDGVFDSRRYQRLLTLNKMKPEKFEAAQKESILELKLRDFIFNNIKLSDMEALEWFKWENTSISIDYALFDPKTYKDMEASDEEITAFFEENKENYKTEPKIKAQFLRFDPKAYQSEIEITDEDILEYYAENQEEFKKEKTVEARHILIKVAQDEKEEQVEEKREKALEILKMIQEEGKDFAELAKEYSEDPGSKQRGGDLGAFAKDRMVKPFSDKAFSMKPGEVSEPVRTQFGWHIIKVEKVNEEKTLTLEEAKEQISKKLTDEKAKAIAYKKAESVYDTCFEGDNLAKVAETKGLQILTTDFFTRRKGPEKDVKDRYKFASNAFQLDIMQISTVQDFKDGYYLIQPVEKIPEEISKFDDVKDKVRTDLIKEKQDEIAQKDADAFLAALKEGESFEKESKKYNVTPKATEFFKRNSAIPEIGYEREISEAAFNLSGEKGLPEKVFKGKKGYYVIRFKESKIPDAEEFEKEKKEVREKLVRQKQFKMFEKWLSQIRDKSEIVRFLN